MYIDGTRILTASPPYQIYTITLAQEVSDKHDNALVKYHR